MKAWPGGPPVGISGDLQATFSPLTGRGDIWIVGLSEVCAVCEENLPFLFGFCVRVKCVKFC